MGWAERKGYLGDACDSVWLLLTDATSLSPLRTCNKDPLMWWCGYVAWDAPGGNLRDSMRYVRAFIRSKSVALSLHKLVCNVALK